LHSGIRKRKLLEYGKENRVGGNEVAGQTSTAPGVVPDRRESFERWIIEDCQMSLGMQLNGFQWLLFTSETLNYCFTQ